MHTADIGKLKKYWITNTSNFITLHCQPKTIVQDNAMMITKLTAKQHRTLFLDKTGCLSWSSDQSGVRDWHGHWPMSGGTEHIAHHRQPRTGLAHNFNSLHLHHSDKEERAAGAAWWRHHVNQTNLWVQSLFTLLQFYLNSRMSVFLSRERWTI